MSLTKPMQIALELVRSGRSAASAAKACGVSERLLRELAARHGIAIKRARRVRGSELKLEIAVALVGRGSSIRDAARSTGSDRRELQRVLARRIADVSSSNPVGDA